MKTIEFVTTNSRKLTEARLAFEPYGISVHQRDMELDEIQSKDFVEVARRKATDAYGVTKSPVAVTDTAWVIPALGGFPGAYMKEVAEWFGPEDFLALMEGKSDRRIAFVETIAYCNGRETRIFSKEYWGELVTAPRGEGNSIEQLAIFGGDKTIAEQHDGGKMSHDPKDFVWSDFAAWYAEQR